MRRVLQPGESRADADPPGSVRAQDLDQAAKALCRSDGNYAEFVGRSNSPGRAHVYCVERALDAEARAIGGITDLGDDDSNAPSCGRSRSWVMSHRVCR